MSAALVTLLVLIGAAVILAVVAPLLDRRAKARGNLFSGRTSVASRVVAFLFALLFGGLSIYQAVKLGAVTVVLPLLAVAFLAYALGWNSLVDRMQRRRR